jgi:hypothetical protein
MYRLVYYSENRVSAGGADLLAAIDDILSKSRRNNALVGVTGALMFSAGRFGQVLEGPQAAVEATFERIQQDTRHGDVALLEFVPIYERAFDTWAMAYVGDRPDGLTEWANEKGFDREKITGQALFRKLHAMVASSSEHG